MDTKTKNAFFRVMNSYLKNSKKFYLYIINITSDDFDDVDKLESHKDVYLAESKFLKSIIDKKPIEYITIQFNQYKTFSHIHIEKSSDLCKEDLIQEETYIITCNRFKEQYEYYCDIYNKVILTGVYL